MPVWIITIVLAAMRAFYIALFQGALLWCAWNYFLISIFNNIPIGFALCFIIMFIPNFVVSCIKVYRLLKD